MTHESSPPPEGGDTLSNTEESLQTNTLKEVGVFALGALELDTSVAQFEIYDRFENEGFVKQAPRFREQLQEESRQNTVTYIPGMNEALGPDTVSYLLMKEEVTEIEALRALDDFLQVVERELPDTHHAEQARSMRKDLTFIGEREYAEAATGIAEYWKAWLDEHPDKQILAVTGRIDSNKVKSDEILLEHVLANFSEEEFGEYKDRLVVDAPSIGTVDPKYTKIVLLDDWAISGLQMTAVYEEIVKSRPELEGAMEIQLIAADPLLIEDGMMYVKAGGVESRIPVSAYYESHLADDPDVVAYYAGAHAAGDYGFEFILKDMVNALTERGVPNSGMPPPANIVRTYTARKASPDSMLPNKQKWSQA